MVKSISKQAILDELRRRQEKVLEDALKPQFVFNKHCFEEQIKFFRDEGARFRCVVASRRAGKCRIKGTLVKTPTGSVEIQNLKPGDNVYGYNNDGTVSICQVTSLWDQGEQEVVDLIWNRTVMATSTMNHKWLTHSPYTQKRTVKELQDFNISDKIAMEYTPIPGGTKHVPEAYAIGALLGDGCSRDPGVVISGIDMNVLEKVQSILGCELKKSHENNHSWRLKGLKASDDKLKHYNQWCRNRYAHEKTLNLQEVRTWTRESQLELLAGLIDTDGSVSKTKDERLHIRLTMQAKSIIDACQLLILDLFQFKPQIIIDNRPKYKNGPVYTLSINNNRFSKRILKELPTACLRKQWKPEYENLNERNTSENSLGFKLSKPYKAQCYDISINNDSSLFLDANGLIGHNTIGVASDMIDTCLNEKGVRCLYITLSKRSAKNIIWGDLKNIIEKYEIDCTPHEVELSITFPNGSKIHIEGAKDKSEIEKYRGWKLRKCYIDEAQSFRSYIKDLVDDIIAPALRDLRGELYLTGTPGPIPAGYYYDCSQSTTWKNHKWTAFDNPYMHDPDNGLDLNITLAEERELRGIDESDPSYRRETFGEWIEDQDSLVYKYDEHINHYDLLPEGEYTYLMGIDIGYDDADAIAVLAYSSTHNKVYLVEEHLMPKRTISQLADTIIELDVHYNCVKKVIDSGGLGKKIQEEIVQRYGINLEAAEKSRKIEFIELMNSDLRRGMVKAKKNSAFAEDCRLVQWDRDKSTPDRLVVSNVYHSDITDAVLYAYREARHYLYKPTPAKHRIGTDAYMEELEAKEAQKLEDAKHKDELLELDENDMMELESMMDDLL